MKNSSYMSQQYDKNNPELLTKVAKNLEQLKNIRQVKSLKTNDNQKT